MRPPAREALVFLPCPAGVESLLGAEVAAIAGRSGAARHAIAERRGGVELRAPAPEAAFLVLALNLESRLAQRVLWRVAAGDGRHEDDLYELARAVRWNEWITPRQGLRVDVTSRNSPLRSLRFAGLRVKDAVCDLMRDRTGARPDVSLDAPDLPILLHLDGESATLYVDTSGEALFKRGWRTRTGDAPLKETLAAVLLAAAGWDGSEESGPLLDPCCGAGTIAIEVAQLACGIAPGAARRFAFERLGPFRGLGRDWRG
ncbi:MAG: class I SAM-dependent RNA methyltransferase, partial [Alphaproteobacteria bacterium]